MIFKLLLLLFSIVLKEIENVCADMKTVEISPSKEIFQEVNTTQVVNCIKNDICVKNVSTYDINTVLYEISYVKDKFFEVRFSIAETTVTSTKVTAGYVNRDFNATLLNGCTVKVCFNSEKPAVYRFTCVNEEDNTEAYTRIRFGYRPRLSSIHLEKDVYDDISIYITPHNIDTDPNSEYWNIICQSSEMRSNWKECVVRNYNNTWYRFSGDQNYFSFNITGRNNFGVYSKIYNYSKRKIPVKLPTFENITKTVLKDSIQLHFQLKRIPEVLSLQKQYKVWYRSERDPKDHWKIKRSSSGKIILKYLSPFTNYTILASVREKRSTIWNKNVTLKIKTKSAAPSSPHTTNGSFQDWICPNTNKRCLTVFWQSLPLKDRNDILIGYCVQYIGERLSNNNTDQCLDSNNIVVDSLKKDFEYLPKNETLIFSIVAVTKSRRISQPTFIQVKNITPVKPQTVYVKRISEKMYNVSWLLKQPQEIVNVTVFWCQGEMSYKIECTDDVQWNTVTKQSYSLVNSSQKQLPVFAAYVNTEEGSSSLTNAECIFTPGKPTKPPKPNIVWSDTKFVLTWPTLQCSHWNGIPVAYVLRYAKGKRCVNGMKKEYLVAGIKAVKSTVVINGLVADTEYSVCLQVKTMEDISLMSETVTETTKDNDASKIVYILLPLCIILILITLATPLIRRYMKVWKEIIIQPLKSSPQRYKDIAMTPFDLREAPLVETILPSQVNSDSEFVEPLTENTLETDEIANSATSLLHSNVQDSGNGYMDELKEGFRDSSESSHNFVANVYNGYVDEPGGYTLTQSTSDSLPTNSNAMNSDGDIVKVMEFLTDEIHDRNIEDNIQGISQNPSGLCDMKDNNFGKISNSLQTETTEDDFKNLKVNILQETDQSDYVKTESFYYT